MSQELKSESNSSSTSENVLRKYKIGKVKQTPTVQIDSTTGESFIQLKAREDEKVYGCTKFHNHYREDTKLGQGTFGEVYKGIHLETQRQVAMKRIIINMEKDLFPITAQREITILKKLSHRNVIKLLEMVYDFPPSSNQNSHTMIQDDPTIPKPSKSFYMILPYMVADLSGVLHNPRITLKMTDIKNMMLQILEGLNYIHCSKFMHRDIKTANILIDHNGILKIADFGLARLYYGSPPNLKYPGGAGTGAKYTSVVVTRWYRAPELVLGDKYYTTAVDIWGVGCVFAEFFEKKPILQGTSDVDQGHAIFKLLGTPTKDEWEMAKYLPGKELLSTSYKSTLKERFGQYLNDTGLHFLEKLLALDPMKRYTTMAAKLDPFFTEEPLPSEKLVLPCEESHEADIKRYKEEMHQAMSQKAPTAPQGHRFEPSSNVVPGTIQGNKPIPHVSPTRVSTRLPPSGPAPKKPRYQESIPTGPVSDTSMKYSTKAPPSKHVFKNAERPQAKNLDVSGKPPSRYAPSYNDATVPPSSSSNKSTYPNKHIQQSYSSHQPYSNRYQKSNEYDNGNYRTQKIYPSQYHSTTHVQHGINTRYSSQGYVRYNKGSDGHIAPVLEHSIPKHPSAQAYKPSQPSQTSRYQPSKIPSKPAGTMVTASLHDRITANPIVDTKNEALVQKAYGQRSYSFNSSKKPTVVRESKPPQKVKDEESGSDTNLADLY